MMGFELLIVAAGPKPTVLYSNYDFIRHLFLPLPAGVDWDSDMARRTVRVAGHRFMLPAVQFGRTQNELGQITVSGGADLKTSQHYPVLFGQSVAELVVAQKAAMIEGMFGV